MTAKTNIKRRHHGGSSSVEFGLLVPILFTIFLALVQVIIYIQSSISTQYAAFLAARVYQVYGGRTLETINYKRVRGFPYTQKEQTIAEAAAEKIIFESLLWEHKKVFVNGDADSLDRSYKDGMDLSRDGVQMGTSEGAVRMNLRTGQGVEVTYCAPIFASGIQKLFALTKKKYPCKNSREGFNNEGIAIVKKATFGVEPEVTP